MKVTTLFGSATSSSSGGGMVNNTSVGVNDKSNKNSKNKIDDHHSFIPVQLSPSPTSGGSIMPGAPPAVERASSEVLYSSITPSANGNGFARSRRSLAEPPGGPPAIMGSGGGGINTGSTSTLTSNGHLHSYSNSYTINGNHHNNSISVNGGNNNGGGNDGNNNDTEQQQNIYEDIDQYQQREPPPMIAPISGVPNLKGKAVIRPIAFRPIPGGGTAPGTHSGQSTPTASGPPSSFRPPSNGPPPLPSGHPSSGNQAHIGGNISGGGSASLGYFIGGNNSRNVLAPSPATSTTSSQHCIGPYKNGHGPSATGGGIQNGPPINGKVNNGGFAPGHPLATNDGRRHYGSNQELHVVHQSAPPPVFNKFNSLDRRALSRRHHQQSIVNGGDRGAHLGSNSMGLLKIAPHSTTMLNGGGCGSESLPPVSTNSIQTGSIGGGSQRSLHPSLSSSTNNINGFNPVRTTMNGQYANTTPQPVNAAINASSNGPATSAGNSGVANSNKLIKEPERRHSSYDPASRGGGSHYATPTTVSINGELSSTNHVSSRSSETGTPSNSSTLSSNRLRLSNSNSNVSNNKNATGSNSTLPNKASLSAQRSNPINTNGLPDPFGGSISITNVARKIQNFNNNNHHPHHGSTSLYSSQESLSKNNSSSILPSTTTSININSKAGSSSNTTGSRPNAGTPQFQNLSGAIRGGGAPTSGSTRITNTNYFNQQQSINGAPVNASSSSSSPYVSIMPRSMSGNNLNSLESTISHANANGNHVSNSSSGHNGANNGGRNHTSGSSSGCSSSSAASQHSNGSGGDPSSVMNQTPSPSDSAVGDLESMLREKDTEINYLRETMEQNEQVIFKVYEEKEKMWERELRKIKGLYDNRLRASQQKSSKMEQALTNQTYQLQSDRRKLESELEEIRRHKEEQMAEKEQLQKELLELRSKLGTSSDANDSQTLISSNSLSTDSDSSLTSAHGLEKSSSKFILSQSKKPSGATKSNDQEDIEDTNNSANDFESKSALELKVQVKDMKIELERRETELKDLQMGKKSLVQEVSKLKSLLDVAAASTRALNSGNKKSGNKSGDDNEDEDDLEDVSFIREEVATQKEIIIARDQVIEKLQRELECVNVTINQLKEEAETTKECFEAEKAHWIDEKEKVIRYQKQLQLNYVQMYKRNKTLEAEIETLNKNFAEIEKQLEQSQQKLKEKEQKERPGSSSSNTSGNTSSSKGAAAAQSMIRKTGNSVRARLLKMSLHSESQC